jgi:hypothetical protein
MRPPKLTICTVLLAALLLPAAAFGTQLGLRYSGKSWDCIALSGDDYFLLPFRDSKPMQGGSGPAVMWNNYPVMCQVIPARKVARSRDLGDTQKALQAYGVWETKYQTKQGAECGPVKIVSFGGNPWGTMTMRNRINTTQGVLDAKVYAAWTMIGESLLITTIQADGSGSLDTAKSYLHSCLGKLRKFPHRVHFEDFLRGQ